MFMRLPWAGLEELDRVLRALTCRVMPPNGWSNGKGLGPAPMPYALLLLTPLWHAFLENYRRTETEGHGAIDLRSRIEMLAS